VLQAYYGYEDRDLWQLAIGLGAGVSRRGLVCGAVTGGALACGMAAGLKRGSTRDDLPGLREACYSKAQEMMRRFEARFGTLSCREMTGCDFLTPEGHTAFRENQILDRICRPAVRLVVETVADLIDRG